jgi:hypothetical protein
MHMMHGAMFVWWLVGILLVVLLVSLLPGCSKSELGRRNRRGKIPKIGG